MVEYVNELPKLSVELDQLNEHKRELEVSHNMDHCMTSRHDNTVPALLFTASIISSMAKIHNFIFTKLTRLLLEVPTRH